MAKVMKECKVHGETPHVKRPNGYYRCQKCTTEGVSRWRKKVKKMAIEYKGGACMGCGFKFKAYPEVFEFHHVDPSKKDFGISGNGFCKSWDTVKEELDKCMLVCANCHRIIHVDLKHQ